MKHIFTICLLLLSTAAFSQNMSGHVKDHVTKSGIGSVQIIHGKKTVLTNVNGEFVLTDVKVGDRIGFRVMGYESAEVEVTRENLSSPTVIYLKSKPLELQVVNIRASRLHKKDSLMLRKEYAAVFNYKAPKFTDMLNRINPEQKYPLALVRPPSTASIVSLNALQLLSFIGRKKNTTSKLKTTLLLDEAKNYVNERFSKTKVQNITALQGDSLTVFMERFAPTATQLRAMNDYQLLIHIKSKHTEFTQKN